MGGVTIYTDGTNYFTQRGMGSGGVLSSAAPVLVNFSSGGQNGGPFTTVASAAQSITAGNAIVVCMRWGASAVTDTAGNTYSRLPFLAGQGSASDGAQFWYCNNCKGNAANVVTATLTAGSTDTYTFIAVWQVSGALLSFDTQLSTLSGGSSSTSLVSSSFNTTYSSEIVFAVGMSSSALNSLTAGAGWVLDAGGISGNTAGAEHAIYTTSQSGITATMTQSSSTPWQMFICAFGSTPVMTDTFVLGTPDPAGLPNSIANPTAYYGVDVQPKTAGSLDDEFNGTFNTSRWSWMNQGSSTATLSKSLLTLSGPNNGSTSTDNNVCVYQSTPATPWTVITKLNGLMPFAGNNRTGLFVSDGTKLVMYSVLSVGTDSPQLIIQNYTNVTTFSASLTQFNQNVPAGGVWLQVQDDGTNLNWSVSFDGVNYWLIYQGARLAFLASVSRVGLYVNPAFGTSSGSSSAPRLATYAASFDYFRRTQ